MGINFKDLANQSEDLARLAGNALGILLFICVGILALDGVLCIIF